MEYEAGGYPITPTGVSPGIWRLAVAAGRRFENKDKNTEQVQQYVYRESIGELEQQLRLAEASLAAARDPDVAISSANPTQMVWSPTGNYAERSTIRQSVALASNRLGSRRTIIHQYVLRKHYELKFSSIAGDVFSRIREKVDESIGQPYPPLFRSWPRFTITCALIIPRTGRMLFTAAVEYCKIWQTWSSLQPTKIVLWRKKGNRSQLSWDATTTSTESWHSSKIQLPHNGSKTWPALTWGSWETDSTACFKRLRRDPTAQ